ncbi:MAG: sialidase family protein [Kiritimatiellae bacterium]|nr:sialidase family protein [Kiritimatiellia bacterium]MDD5522290.1 sialidase family protein [Kiritimatiellia bacterium]
MNCQKKQFLLTNLTITTFCGRIPIISFLTMVSLCVTLAGPAADEGRWVHPLCQSLAIDRSGPFLTMSDGGLMGLSTKGLRISKDDGKTWSEPQPVCQDIHPTEPASFYLLQTTRGALVVVYLNAATQKFAWDDKAGEPKEGCCLEIWAIRSLDGGKTWIDRQRILDGYNANFFGFIQTRSGKLVATVEHLATNPGRHVVCSLLSEDDGKTWRRSNLIDLGGRGHHDGATEPTVAQLSDGRLLMLIRTNLDRFWQAFSEDDGRYWRSFGPSTIDASSSPGHLLRLQSGRLVLLWNRLSPEGQPVPRSKPNVAHEVSPSWHREELSLAFSEDDARTWTKPFVIARQKKGQLSYPYLFERRPGELWLMAGFAFKQGWKEPFPLRLCAREEELLREAKKTQALSAP